MAVCDVRHRVHIYHFKKHKVTVTICGCFQMCCLSALISHAAALMVFNEDLRGLRLICGSDLWISDLTRFSYEKGLKPTKCDVLILVDNRCE